jgi:hypothetical protein
MRVIGHAMPVLSTPCPPFLGMQRREELRDTLKLPAAFPLHPLVSHPRRPCWSSEGHASSWPRNPVVGGSREESRYTPNPGSVPLHRLVSCLHSPCRCSEGHASSWPRNPVVGVYDGDSGDTPDPSRIPLHLFSPGLVAERATLCQSREGRPPAVC